ncbi:hypothetical protein LMH87_001577 [Akanthomyces muscarius]|uniref:Acyl-protein thioesterase 1 n=1 Tax=Akanthomyces muscarius TaxID=2231603 RepID=A0A9W8UIJ6_AKAMU|nr:hypothetical protein LMH87_001577 [Akanthomyces muscarius]KAJ4147024.1 hypothetical protein LMH87_001577 [Akanthomyces muscarius]
MARARPDPIIIEPSVAITSPEQASAVIFLHGLADDGESFRDLVNQYQNANKLPHTLWVLPTAAENRDAMARAWYGPSKLTQRPTPRPELEDEEDYEGIMESCRYIISIVKDINARNIPTNRIAFGGFSQGCALSLVLGLASEYAGRFAGIFGLMGYLPLEQQLESIRNKHAPEASLVDQPVLIARGMQDALVPSRYFKSCFAALQARQIRKIDMHEYSIGHTLSGQTLADLCIFLEERCGF